MERLDKTFFKKQSLKKADNNRAYWMSKTFGERLEAGYILSKRAYGIDPDNPPPLDKSYFKKKTTGMKGLDFNNYRLVNKILFKIN